jgi:ornithine lipid ester-linked acyl 2-hydroxylase
MTVAGETRTWIEGKCLVFDDTSVHEAWNKSDSDRLILLLDFLRPGCTAESSDQMPVEVQIELADKLKRERSSR